MSERQLQAESNRQKFLEIVLWAVGEFEFLLIEIPKESGKSRSAIVRRAHPEL